MINGGRVKQVCENRSLYSLLEPRLCGAHGVIRAFNSLARLWFDDPHDYSCLSGKYTMSGLRSNNSVIIGTEFRGEI